MYKIAFTGYRGDRVLCQTEYISRDMAETALKELINMLPASMVESCLPEVVVTRLELDNVSATGL